MILKLFLDQNSHWINKTISVLRVSIQICYIFLVYIIISNRYKRTKMCQMTGQSANEKKISTKIRVEI